MEGGRIPAVLAKVVSIALHPVIIPLYIVATLITGGLLLSPVMPRAKLYFFAIVILNIVVVPAVAILLFNGQKAKRQGVSGVFAERVMPMLVMAVCYAASLYLIRDIPFTYPMRKMLIAGTGCLIAGVAVTFFWRISLYMLAQGVAVGFMALLVISGAGYMLAPLCVSIALAASLASARLYLGKHDAAQTAAGFLTGLAITIISAYVF